MHNAPLEPEHLIDALSWRYATKTYDPNRKIPEWSWAALEQALVLTPSSFGIQPWRFFVIDDPAVKERLAEASWGQTQPVDASHFVVFAVRKDLGEEHVDRYVARTAEVRGVAPESLASFKKVMMKSVESARRRGTLDDWNARQVYIALGQFMASAALLRVDTTPMEGLDPVRYDEILGLAGSGWTTVCACAAGYRAADDKYAVIPKVRFRHQEVIHHV